MLFKVSEFKRNNHIKVSMIPLREKENIKGTQSVRLLRLQNENMLLLPSLDMIGVRKNGHIVNI